MVPRRRLGRATAGALAAGLVGFSALAASASASAAPGQVWYQPTSTGDSWVNQGTATIGAGYLASHSGTIDAGNLPGSSIAAYPWNASPGDYCAEHRFAGSATSRTDAPFQTPDSNANLSRVTGLTAGLIPSANAAGYQISDPAPGAWGSACQAVGSHWGFWLNAGDPNGQSLTSGGWCATGCGDEHDISFDDNAAIRPWNGSQFGSGATLQVTGQYQVKNYTASGSGAAGAWLPVCLILQDSASGQVMQDCVDRVGYAGPDGSVAGGDDAAWKPHAQKWIEINSMLDNANPYNSALSGSAMTNPNVIPTALPQSYGFTISSSQLMATVHAVNTSRLMRGCSPVNGAADIAGENECFSTSASNYVLLGVGDGVEMWGQSTTLGATATSPTIQTIN